MYEAKERYNARRIGLLPFLPKCQNGVLLPRLGSRGDLGLSPVAVPRPGSGGGVRALGVNRLAAVGILIAWVGVSKVHFLG